MAAAVLPHRAGRLFGVALVALAVMLVCATAIRLIAGLVGPESPDFPVLPEKVEELVRIGDSYDIMFVGSSRVYRDIDPVAVDAAMADRGCQVRSYNMGVPGLSLPEAAATFDEIASKSSARMRWVFFEDMEVHRSFGFDNRRSRHFARLELLPLIVADIGSAPRFGDRRRREALLDVAMLYSYELLGIGLLSAYLRLEPESDPRFDVYKWLPPVNRAGYVSLDDETAEQFVRRRERYLAQPYSRTRRATPAEQVRDMGRADQVPRRADYLVRMSQSALAIADNVALMMLPRPEFVSFSRLLADQLDSAGTGIPFLDLNSPTVFGPLGDPGLWFDGSHLNAQGAQVFAELLAAQACPVIRETAG